MPSRQMLCMGHVFSLEGVNAIYKYLGCPLTFRSYKLLSKPCRPDSALVCCLFLYPFTPFIMKI